MINRTSKIKAKTSSRKVMCTSSKDVETNVASLIDSEEERIILAAQQDTSLMVRTLSGQWYLKKYDEAMASSS